MTKEGFERIKETYLKREEETGYRTQRDRLIELREYGVLCDIVGLIKEVESLNCLSKFQASFAK